MSARKRTTTNQKFLPRYRIYSGEEIALGPGKVELLRRLRETGSIRDAAAQMDMSYMRAWKLIRTMNECFHAPLVETERGGKEKGGAKLTATGEAVVQLYQQLETESLIATKKTRERLAKLLRS